MTNARDLHRLLTEALTPAADAGILLVNLGANAGLLRWTAMLCHSGESITGMCRILDWVLARTRFSEVGGWKLTPLLTG